jgi:hypothetical protein
MREPLHFTTNWSFVRRLFHEGDLKEWKLRYFDPTQAYLEDRIRKGLLECLMIKRARLTVYNAQEADTFGKDAEAGVTLAQGKPVVVFVARLFEENPELAPIYQAIDGGDRLERDAFVDKLVDGGLLGQKDAASLRPANKTKVDVIECVFRSVGKEAVKRIDESKIKIELIRQGYDPGQAKDDIVSFALERLSKLERRALTFRDIHPLSLQTSPIDGIARGIMVTRTVRDTARVVRGVLLGKLEYEILEADENVLLVEKNTRSPVRVVTKDPILTTAFWSEDWRNSGGAQD